MGGDKMTSSELDAFMEREILECLAELGAPAVVAGTTANSPDVEFKMPDQADVVMDQINSAQVGSDPTHEVYIVPEPTGIVVQSKPEVFWDVPITPARPTNEIDATETVIHSASGTDAGFASFLNVTKSANAGARRSGSLAASVAHTLGYDAATTQTGSPLAIATRITSAKLAAMQGATASAMPSQFQLDVLWTRIGDVATAEDAHTDFHSVYLPSSLSPQCMSALLSLLVEGGPAAYTWRYRHQIGHNGAADAPDPRRAFMPSVSRHLHPGGFNQLLAVTERDVQLPPVGGASLTHAALDALELHYRGVWGHDTFDAAWRSTFTAAAVYAAPEEAEEDNRIAGENFELNRVTHEIHNVNMQGDMFTWLGPQGRHAVGGDAAFPTDANDWRDEGGRDMRRVHNLIWGIARRANAQLPFNYNSCVLDGGGAQFEFRPPEGRGVNDFRAGWDVILEGLPRLVARERRMVQSAMLYFTHQIMADTIGAAADPGGLPVTKDTDIRNVFGARDHVKLSLARLRMFEVVGLIAHYTVPTRRVSSHSSFSRADARARASNFAAHVHILNFLAYVREDFWPCDARRATRAHSAFLRRLPASLRSFCWMEAVTPDGYQEQNWLMLEAPYMIRGADATTAFVGHNVAGSWPVRADGVIDLTGGEVKFAAVDAAYRASVNEGGTIAATGRFGATRFQIVLNQNNLVNPLAFAPRIDTVRGTAGVSLVHDRGPATFQAGGNYVVPIVSVR
ncbi:hypothetical protein [Dactylonectria torresensis alternavirus 1]|nr:hypothetical protein [Dactylonectria torresensis alternavirus 1]